MKVKNLKDAPRPNKKGIPSRTWLGAAFSVLYIGLLIALLIWRSADVAKLDLNALGDFVAGAVGPMAFLWLVLGYLQQGDELQQNTEALRMQAQELEKSVEHQEQLVAITREQFEEAKRESARESARRDAMARPKFETEVVKHWDEPDGTYIQVSLTNVGAPCSHLRLRTDTKGVSATLRNTDQGPQTRLIVIFCEGAAPESVDIFVSYLDSAGNAGTHRLWVTAYADEDVAGFTAGGEDDVSVWTKHAQPGSA
jgi:hypothetical protein